MAARVQIRHGDLFDGPCDLIVLPASTAGTITDFVRTRLEKHGINVPVGPLKYGEVRCIPFSGGENIAQFVAYAASVHSFTSSISAVTTIGRNLAKLTHEYPSIRQISAPLFGTGAGGLKGIESAIALRDGFQGEAADNALLVINVLDVGLVDHLRTQGLRANSARRTEAASAPPPRVFISYTRKDSAHQRWVESLGRWLRANGVDARIDCWHLRLGMDLAQFMANELKLADRVVIVCNEQYAQRANGHLGGVGWETMLIQGDMMSRPQENNKYLALVRCEDVSDGLPMYLKTKYALHWPDSCDELANQQELLAELMNASAAPPLGEPLVFI